MGKQVQGPLLGIALGNELNEARRDFTAIDGRGQETNGGRDVWSGVCGLEDKTDGPIELCLIATWIFA